MRKKNHCSVLILQVSFFKKNPNDVVFQREYRALSVCVLLLRQVGYHLVTEAVNAVKTEKQKGKVLQ